MELNNAVYEPLAMSNSESGKEEIVPSVRKKKRYRKRSWNSQMVYPTTSLKPNHSFSSKLWVGAISICIVWLILLTWFALNLHFQFTILKGLLSEVAAGSQGVPDALQKCHSWSRQLQANQTLLFAHLASLSRHLENITSQIGVVQSGLTHVEGKLTSSPELINVPHEVQDLSASVASFGSQIQDLQTSFNKIKEEQTNVLKLIDSIKYNVTNMNETLKVFSNSYNTTKSNLSETTYSAKFQSILNGVNTKISNINDTISHKIKWILVDQHKDHMAIEALEEMSANITSRLTTLHNDCTGVETLSVKTNNISVLVLKHNQRLDEVQNQLSLVVQKINLVEGRSSKIISEIADLKSILPLHRVIDDDNVSSSSVYPTDKHLKLLPTNGTQSSDLGED